MSTSSQYQREPELGDGLRLHLNENTGGCSPKVIEALRALSPMDAAIYPDYGRVNDVCARHLGVDPSRLLLTNGLDEGILAAAIAYLQRDPGAAAGADAGRPEGLIAEPCFGMYADCIEAVGGRIVRVAPPADLRVPARRHAGRDHAAHARHLPDQPGQPDRPARSRRGGARAGARRCRTAWCSSTRPTPTSPTRTSSASCARAPNVVVGRTFAKAYGLAALRIGAVVGDEAVIARLRRSLPPYSINVAAAVALEAALGDQAHLDAYRAQVRASKARVYAVCDRLGLGYWPSEANFVLVRVGDRATAIVEALRQRRIFVRDRSSEPGCAGCIRITAGILAHTEQALAALEDILCAVA